MDSVLLFASAATATVLILTILLFTFRKTATFEEAVLQPRKQQNQPNVKAKKEVKKKLTDNNSKKKVSKKSAEEDEADSRQESVDVKEGEVKHDHVEFKVSNEVVPLDEEHEHLLSQRKVHANEKPKKPILTNRTDASELSDSSSDARNQMSRTNSFDVMHPKDDYELIRSQQTRDTAVKANQAVGGDDVRDKHKVREGSKRKGKSANVTPKVNRKYHSFLR